MVTLFPPQIGPPPGFPPFNGQESLLIAADWYDDHGDGSKADALRREAKPELRLFKREDKNVFFAYCYVNSERFLGHRGWLSLYLRRDGSLRGSACDLRNTPPPYTSQILIAEENSAYFESAASCRENAIKHGYTVGGDI